MKVAVVGSRNIKDELSVYNMISEAIPRNCSEIVSGGADGVDMLAEKYARENNLHLTVFKPEYDKYGRSAAIIRNSKIVEYSDIVFVFWDMHSKGSASTLAKCIETQKPFKIFRI